MRKAERAVGYGFFGFAIIAIAAWAAALLWVMGAIMGVL